MNSQAFINGYLSKDIVKEADDETRLLPPMAYGGGIGLIGTLLSNYLGGQPISKNVLRNILMGSGVGAGAGLLFPGFGTSPEEEVPADLKAITGKKEPEKEESFI